jgi:hypothetical protein
MTTRRNFVQRTAAASLVGAIALPMAQAREATTKSQKRALSSLPRVKSVVRHDETILRLGGNGSASGITWAADGRQFFSPNEGGGWPGMPRELLFTTALIAVGGGPQDTAFQPLSGYPVRSHRECYKVDGFPPYYGGAILALNGCIYHFLSTQAGPFKLVEVNSELGFDVVGAKPSGWKLIYSSDAGQTWRNQDGSTPVLFEAPKEQSHETMIFWDEDLGPAAILQMGKDYRENRDGFAYIYSGGSEMFSEGGQDKNDVFTLRVPKDEILDRQAYEYFAGMSPNGSARWVKDVNARGSAHSLGRGWIIQSVVYNAPLGTYMMSGYVLNAKGSWVADDYGASKLGFWTAPNAWGPWEQVYEENKWLPGGDPFAAAICPIIVPKWISNDGKSFWLCWSELQHTREKLRRSFFKEALLAASEEEFAKLGLEYRETHEKARFNIQRVDLAIA